MNGKILKLTRGNMRPGRECVRVKDMKISDLTLTVDFFNTFERVVFEDNKGAIKTLKNKFRQIPN